MGPPRDVTGQVDSKRKDMARKSSMEYLKWLVDINPHLNIVTHMAGVWCHGPLLDGASRANKKESDQFCQRRRANPDTGVTQSFGSK